MSAWKSSFIHSKILNCLSDCYAFDNFLLFDNRFVTQTEKLAIKKIDKTENRNIRIRYAVAYATFAETDPTNPLQSPI